MWFSFRRPANVECVPGGPGPGGQTGGPAPPRHLALVAVPGTFFLPSVSRLWNGFDSGSQAVPDVPSFTEFCSSQGRIVNDSDELGAVSAPLLRDFIGRCIGSDDRQRVHIDDLAAHPFLRVPNFYGVS